MNEQGSGVPIPQPGPGDQIAGLSFAMLLISADMKIKEVNPAGEVLLGASALRLVGKNLLDVVQVSQPRLAEELSKPDSQFVTRGLDLAINDQPWRGNMTVSAMATFPGWRVVTLSDASQSDLMEELERLPALRGPAVLAHEIKNPLAAIRGAAQLLERKVSKAEASLTELVITEVDRIAQLLDRMQRLGREQAEPLAPVNLHQSIHQALATVKLTSEDVLSWKEEFDPSLPPVLASEGALVQVLVNLLANARDAAMSHAEPQVQIHTRFVSGLVTNVIRLGRPVRLAVEIRISDNGQGIDPALHDHIFEPFVSSKPNGQGLGLALVQKLVRDMHGRVSHERDEKGGWTHFRIHLPIANAKDTA